jgi:hypothetical protein
LIAGSVDGFNGGSGNENSIAKKGNREAGKMLKASHLNEWLSSAVHPEIIRLNVESLEGDAALERLTENAIEAIGKDKKTPHSYQYATSPVAKILERYKDMSDQGWWAGGIDVLTGQPSRWGCFKPDRPRISQEKGKAIKYEHPAKCPTEIFALRVSYAIGLKIAEKQGLKDDYLVRLGDNSLDSEDREFWQWVIDNPSLVLAFTEGAKKAGSLLSAGYAAIALPGIYSGYRQLKDCHGQPIDLPRLIPQLLPFCGGGREISFFFDQDSKPKTIENVRRAIEKTGKLLTYKGCKVSVARWDKSYKGIDDFIASQGEDELDRVYQERISLDQYKIENFSALTPDLTINERYISQSLEIPDTAKIIGVKAPKGSGKTEWIAAKVEPLLAKGDRVLVITHRVQLGLELSSRFGVNYRSELAKSEDGSLLGYVLCVDSLHGKANPRFNPNDWENTTIIIDEAEQVFWHLLNSPTCEQHRVKIIDSLRELLRTAIATGGEIYVADADLSMNAIGYVRSLIGYPVENFVLENTYKSPLKRDLYLFDGNDPSSLIQELEIAISSGQKAIVHTDGQKHKSKWGTRNLEYFLKKKYPNLKILRIDSESVSDRSHPAYGCMGSINQILPDYDLVICSPVIETGVSININHFDAVFAISHGVQSVDGFAQALARVRADIPRYIWVSEYSPNRIGNGSTDLKQLLSGEHFKARNTIKTLLSVGLKEVSDFSFLEDDQKYSPSLTLWGKNAIKINLEGKNYRELLIKKLENEGYNITPIAPGDEESIEALKDEIKEAKNENYSGHKKSVLNADSLSNSEYDSLKEKRELSEGERNQLKRARIERTYGINLTDELITKDDNNWYPQIRLHYFLTIGNDFLANRDQKKLNDSIENGEGKIFKPDLNKSLISGKIQLMKILDVEQFFGTEKEFTGDSLNDWIEKFKNPRIISQIKSILGFTLSMKDTAISFAQRLLRLLGLKLICVGQRRREDGSRYRLYQGCDPLSDGRGEVFDRWIERDLIDHPDKYEEVTSIAA